jgi:DNA-directed RNA polymerase specialized sigma subunit
MSFSLQNKLEPEFTDAFNTWKATPNPATNTSLLKAVSPVIDTALRSYGTQSPTLRSRAKQMTLSAMQTYDPSRGKLRTHLLSQLQGLRRYSAQEQNIISLPEQVALDQKFLHDQENNLRDFLGRDPSDAEIADHTGISLKRLNYVRQFKPPLAESTVSRPTDDGSDILEPGVRHLGRDDEGEAWLDFVYADLGDTDRVIMDYTLGRNGSPKLPVTEVARRLGITPSAASQRLARIQGLIDERQSLGIL